MIFLVQSFHNIDITIIAVKKLLTRQNEYRPKQLQVFLLQWLTNQLCDEKVEKPEFERARLRFLANFKKIPLSESFFMCRKMGGINEKLTRSLSWYDISIAYNLLTSNQPFTSSPGKFYLPVKPFNIWEDLIPLAKSKVILHKQPFFHYSNGTYHQPEHPDIGRTDEWFRQCNSTHHHAVIA